MLLKVVGARLPCLLLALPLVWAGFQGIPGNFCRNRLPSECCTDRHDDCAVKIRNTLCYCDEFCLNRDDSTGLDNDCCPDFREVCLGDVGIPDYPGDEPGADPYIVCEKDGITVPHGATHKFNCRQCKCEGGTLGCEKIDCLVEEEIIEKVNQAPDTFTWTATNYSKFWGWKAEQGVRLRTGAIAPTFNMLPIRLSPVAALIPREFDARKKRDWQGLISGVRDQGWCGSSWAFSAVAVAQDRLAIVTRDGTTQLSPEQLVECAQKNSDSCRVGGHIDIAWNYLRKVGVVREDCLPYQSGNLANSAPECRVPRGSTDRLPCQNPDLHKMEPAFRISSKVEDIQWEIMNNGPVQALMRVTRELFVYGSGVFGCGGMAGGAPQHAVRLMGWGEQVLKPGARPTKYWLVANTWGDDWGEEGFFRIHRGSDECDIESHIYATRPRLANIMYGN